MINTPLLRGLTFGIPLSLALWGALYMGLHEALPPQDRHAITAEARQMLTATCHDLRMALIAEHRA